MSSNTSADNLCAPNNQLCSKNTAAPHLLSPRSLPPLMSPIYFTPLPTLLLASLRSSVFVYLETVSSPQLVWVPDFCFSSLVIHLLFSSPPVEYVNKTASLFKQEIYYFRIYIYIYIVYIGWAFHTPYQSLSNFITTHETITLKKSPDFCSKDAF